MLLQLEIHNIALIDKVNIEFGKGLNILTGETGAGKSIIIDSINAILGGRVSKDLIRSGKEKALIEAVFEIDPERFLSLFESLGLQIEEDNTLILSREFSLSGKNTCRLNGKMVPLSMLKEIGGKIIDIHGQHDNQSLLYPDSHIELLDLFCGEILLKLKRDYIELLSQRREIRSKLKSLSGDKHERERKIDLLNFQIEEIRKAKLKTGEDEELNKQRIILGNSEKIINSLSRAYGLVFSGQNGKSSAMDKLDKAKAELSSIARFNENYENLSKKLEELSFQFEDLVEEIRNERDSVEFSPDLLEKIDERLDLIFRLKKKYGNSIEDILKYQNSIEAELDEIIKSEDIINDLNSRLETLNSKLFNAAKEINSLRVKAARDLENKITAQLDDLEMKKAQFKVNIDFDDTLDAVGERRFSSHGLDKVEFLISPNAGEPLKSLSKIASGGEMSRIMLAIKTILADVDKVPTLIFDEIDIGVSGRAAQKVGEKLSYISKNHQVLCITHLSQIACMSDNHYLIEKVAQRNSTHTRVKKISGGELSREIARIIGGSNISDITLRHAEEMLENARSFKDNT